MPLAKGSSQKTISSNISELVGSFCKPVFYVLHMLKGMAIWAKDFKVFHVIIFGVSVFVMNAQNFWLRIVRASFAPVNQSPSQHVSANGPKGGQPNVFLWFVYANFAAINSCFRWASQKRFFAMLAGTSNRTFNSLRFIVTLSTAILCFVGSRRYVRKFVAAHFAICNNLNSRCKRLAGSRTILKAIKSVSRYVNKNFAMPTRRLLPSVES